MPSDERLPPLGGGIRAIPITAAIGEPEVANEPKTVKRRSQKEDPELARWVDLAARIGPEQAYALFETRRPGRQDSAQIWREQIVPAIPSRLDNIKRVIALRLAAQAAHDIMGTKTRVTREGIFEIIEKDQPGLTYASLLKQWQRHKPPITLGVILEEAGSL